MSTQPPAYLVPGTPIRVADMVAGTKLSEGEKATYGSYLPILLDGWTSPTGHHYEGVGHRWAHEVLPSELDTLVEAVLERALITSATRDQNREEAGRATKESKGESAVYNAVGAFRKVFASGVRDRHLAKGFDPSQEVKKPSRPASARRPLTGDQLQEMWGVVLNGGNDPDLDAMMCNFIIITGARREGVINLNVRDIVVATGMVWLDEKNDERVEQPAPDWFLRQLLSFAASRGSVRPGDPVFRYKAGRRSGGPNSQALGRVGDSRFHTLFSRIQASLEWADQVGLSAHTLRHHGSALLSRQNGLHVSEAWLRHKPDKLSMLYGQATPAEVAAAVVELHGGSHPLA